LFQGMPESLMGIDQRGVDGVFDLAAAG
jgi:hypothetical protein